MPGEPDQTKWVGVRPTDPAVAIPVTESAPLTGLYTKKAAPAITDLQAIKAPLAVQVQAIGVDTSVSYTLDTGAVPAGEIWVVTNIHAINTVTMNDVYLYWFHDGNWYRAADGHSIEIGNSLFYQSFIVLDQSDYIRAQFLYGGASDNVFLAIGGYTVGVY
jgi:hypothetical protein